MGFEQTLTGAIKAVAIDDGEHKMRLKGVGV
jgi:hypothetical protein